MPWYRWGSNGLEAGDSGSEETQKQGQPNPQHLPISGHFSSGIAPHPTDYMMSQAHFEAGQSMVWRPFILLT